MMYSIALRIATFSTRRIDEKEGKYRNQENYVDGIQKAAPTPEGDLERPSVKIGMASEKF